MRDGKRIIGIDFGTTFSEVAYMEDDLALIIPNQEGQNKTPSIVAFTKENEVLVGEMARRQAALNPQFTIPSIKRILGLDYYDIEERGDKLNFLIEDKAGKLIIKVGEREVTPEEIAGLILGKLKQAAEQYLGEEIKFAVITVPAYYDDLQREATLKGAKLAGLEVVRLINEPTAAAMAYGLQKKQQETIAVYDFGGGTFDISILQVEENTFEVLSTFGDTFLGGENIDNDLAELIAREFYEDYGIDLSEEPAVFLRLKEAVEAAKCELSTTKQTLISLPFIARSDKGVLHLERRVERGELEKILQPYLHRTLECCQQALSNAALTPKDITCVVLVGGTTRIPAVRQAVAEFFGKQPVVGLNPDEIVAMGAAIQAGVLEGKLQEVVLLDVTPHSLGIETKDNNFSKLIERNSTIPIKASKMFTTTTDRQQFVHIHVLQGESPQASENRSLGKFTLMDIPPAAPGVPRIRVSFFINSDGVIEVSAAELSSGVEKKLTLVHSLIPEEKRRERRVARQRTPDLRRPRRVRLPEVKIPLTRQQKVEEERPGVAKPVEEAIGYQVVEPDETALDLIAEKSLKDDTKAETQIRQRPSSLFAARPEIELEEGERAKISFSPEFHEALRRLTEGDISAIAIAKYQKAITELEEKIARHPASINLYYLLIKLYLYTSGHKVALELIGQIKAQKKVPLENLAPLYDTVIRAAPTSLEARKGRALFYLEQGYYDHAIGDLEVLYEKEQDIEWLRKIAEAYEHILERTENPAIKFRLVKTYFKLGELDKAIQLLQGLIDLEEFRTRALKILGLCLWQKKLFVKAWQRFKLLPIDEELAALVYRLAQDMEEAEQIKPAANVYMRLIDYDPNYRDVNVRLKRLNYRLRLQEEEEIVPTEIDLKESRFLIIEEIDRGSMGVIYKARDVILDEIVAIKVLNETLLRDEQAIKRFKLEAKAAKKLSHPYIVRIHDFYESGGKKFISMEYIEGADLRKLLREKKNLSEDEVQKYAAQICEALVYAHSIGVVHRDLKPANIMITKKGDVKITDFGIAKIVSLDEMTRTGTAVIGTPLYMSPEQILGGKIDQRTDIYALGVLLYEMLNGKPPFYQGNVEYQHVHSEPPPLPDSVSLKLREIVMKCIKKKPEERFSNVGELLQSLKS